MNPEQARRIPYLVRSPVALLVYNRPHLTRQILARIKEVRPATLLVVADGPKNNDPIDARRCEAVKTTIAQDVDWKCDLKTNFADTNLGCGRRIASGLDWVFEEVPEAIILEDDTLPDHSFFRFCDELLERYRNDTEIGQICGFRSIDQPVLGKDVSYFFSRHSPIWGWASWARAWKKNDYERTRWSWKEGTRRLRAKDLSFREVIWRNTINARIGVGQLDTWDYQWEYAKLTEGFINIIPAVNLIKNIGIGPDSTHTRNVAINPDSQTLEFPLQHPEHTQPHLQYDRLLLRQTLPSWPWILWLAAKYLAGAARMPSWSTRTQGSEET